MRARIIDIYPGGAPIDLSDIEEPPGLLGITQQELEALDAKDAAEVAEIDPDGKIAAFVDRYGLDNVAAEVARINGEAH